MKKLTATLCLITALAIGFILGIAWTGSVHDGADSEYFQSTQNNGWFWDILDRCDISVLCGLTCRFSESAWNILRGIEYLGVYNHPTTDYRNSTDLGAKITAKD